MIGEMGGARDEDPGASASLTSVIASTRAIQRCASSRSRSRRLAHSASLTSPASPTLRIVGIVERLLPEAPAVHEFEASTSRDPRGPQETTGGARCGRVGGRQRVERTKQARVVGIEGFHPDVAEAPSTSSRSIESTGERTVTASMKVLLPAVRIGRLASSYNACQWVASITAVAASAALILSSPIAAELRAGLRDALGERFVMAVLIAIAAPCVMAVVAVIATIREDRVVRSALLLGALALAVICSHTSRPAIARSMLSRRCTFSSTAA